MILKKSAISTRKRLDFVQAAARLLRFVPTHRPERNEKSLTMSGKYFFRNLKNNYADKTNGPFDERVVGERGRKDLPPGTEGGENLKSDRHYEHKQHTFDSYCKKVLKCEAYNGYREISRRQKREILFCELPEETMAQLAAYDRYPWEYTSFPVGGEVILIEDDRLAEALTALPPENRDILLMYWFLEMADREIAEYLHMARRTVNTRRQKAYRLLKELMGGEADD